MTHNQGFLDRLADALCLLLALPSLLVLCVAIALTTRSRPLVRLGGELRFRPDVPGTLGWVLASGCLDYLPQLLDRALPQPHIGMGI
jgi:hypothetical protein